MCRAQLPIEKRVSETTSDLSQPSASGAIDLLTLQTSAVFKFVSESPGTPPPAPTPPPLPALSQSATRLTSLLHRRLPLPLVNVVVVLQPSGVERIFSPCRGPGMAGRFGLTWGMQS
jgi:hypothetical protein